MDCLPDLRHPPPDPAMTTLTFICLAGLLYVQPVGERLLIPIMIYGTSGSKLTHGKASLSGRAHAICGQAELASSHFFDMGTPVRKVGARHAVDAVRRRLAAGFLAGRQLGALAGDGLLSRMREVAGHHSNSVPRMMTNPTGSRGSHLL